MTPEEIRMAASNIEKHASSIGAQPGGIPGTDVLIQVLMEISAQLAELNQNVRELADFSRRTP